MILEGIVTTHNSDGTVNVSPMGPEVGDEALGNQFVLKPLHWIIHLTLVIFSNGWWLLLFVPYFFLKPKKCPVCLNSKLTNHPMGNKF